MRSNDNVYNRIFGELYPSRWQKFLNGTWSTFLVAVAVVVGVPLALGAAGLLVGLMVALIAVCLVIAAAAIVVVGVPLVTCLLVAVVGMRLTGMSSADTAVVVKAVCEYFGEKKKEEAEPSAEEIAAMAQSAMERVVAKSEDDFFGQPIPRSPTIHSNVVHLDKALPCPDCGSTEKSHCNQVVMPIMSSYLSGGAYIDGK